MPGAPDGRDLYHFQKLEGSEPEFAALGSVYAEAFATYPLARALTGALLIQRIEALDARFGVRTSSCRVDANDCIFLSAEAADPGLVDRKRNRLHGVADVRAAGYSAGAGRE